ncbi:MAG: glycosyltransferase family 4 protein [Candidatus Eisenbacteria bacterium]
MNWRDRKNPEAGGAEVHLHEIFGRIASAGHHVTLLAHRYPGGAPEEMVDGLRVVRIAGKFDFNFHVVPYYKKRLRAERFDVVVEDLNKLPFFLHRAAESPSAAVLHHFFGDSIWKETNPLFASYVRLGEWAVKKTYRAVPFCAVSESTAAELVASGFDPGRVRIIHNAVDHGVYRVDESAARVKGRVIYLGRVKRYKGIDFLIRALARIRRTRPEVHLTVVGSGDDLPRLARVARGLGVDGAVEFTGFVDTETKVRLLRESEIMVTPSPKEGWGVTTIEANACGTPVIASDVPGLRDAVRRDETGLLFPYGDVAALTAAMERLLADDELRGRFSRAAIEWAARFTWERSAEETLAWLESVIENAPSGR